MGLVLTKDWENLLMNILNPCNRLIFVNNREEAQKLFREFNRHRRVLENRLNEYAEDFVDKIDSFPETKNVRLR